MKTVYQLLATQRWIAVEVVNGKVVELCPCTIGHSYEFEAYQCVHIQERIKNPEARLENDNKCYDCYFYDHAVVPAKFSAYGVIGLGNARVKGKVFVEFCKHPALQREEDDYNEEYRERDSAEEECADYDYKYFDNTKRE